MAMKVEVKGVIGKYSTSVALSDMMKNGASFTEKKVGDRGEKVSPLFSRPTFFFLPFLSSSVLLSHSFFFSFETNSPHQSRCLKKRT